MEPDRISENPFAYQCLPYLIASAQLEGLSSVSYNETSTIRRNPQSGRQKYTTAE